MVGDPNTRGQRLHDVCWELVRANRDDGDVLERQQFAW